MIHTIRLENDEANYQLLLEDDFCSYTHHVDPDMLVEALGPYLAHLAVGESIRVERLRAGGGSWADYQEAQARTDPEWAEGLAESGDLLRKQERENR